MTVEDDAESYNHKVDSQERKQCEHGIGWLDVMMSRIWALLPWFGMFDMGPGGCARSNADLKEIDRAEYHTTDGI